MRAKLLLPVVVVPRFNQKTELNRKTDTSEIDNRWSLQDRSADKHSLRHIKWENKMESRENPKGSISLWIDKEQTGSRLRQVRQVHGALIAKKPQR